MMLRWMLSQLLRQTAEKKIHEAVSGVARQHLGGGPQQAGQARTGQAEPDEPAPSEPLPPCQVALVFALGIESGGLVDLMDDPTTHRQASLLQRDGLLDGQRIVVAESGVGRQAAAAATAELIAEHRPAWVVSAGFAGALRDELRRGHILMADQVADLHGKRIDVGLKLDPQTVQSTRGLHVGRLLTVDQVVRTPEMRRQLGAEHQAWACDMETMAVAQVCSEHNIRFLAVRVISDAVDDVLPPEIEGLLDQQSLAGKLGAATGALFNRPSSVKDMWNLREQALKASDRLARFLRGVVTQLTAPGSG